jgi:hypothetical protein
VLCTRLALVIWVRSPFWLGLEPGRKCQLPLGLLLWYPIFMGKSIKGTPKKKRGRPATTGRGAQIGMRWHDLQLSAIDEWRTKHDVASRPEAIRRLVELGLKAKPKA